MPEDERPPPPKRRSPNKIKGDLAEADARNRLDKEGYDTFELKNGSEHGPDIIAIHRDTGAVRVVEVKANTSTLNPLQQMGGPDYLRNVYGRIDRLPNGGTWNNREFRAWLRARNKTREDILKGDFQVWKYEGVDPNAKTQVPNAPNTTNWNAGTTNTQFKLDAQGNILSRRGDSRDWTEYVEPDEYTD